MSTCTYLFIIKFLYRTDSGLAIVSAPSESVAMTVLKNGGLYNGDPDGYILEQSRNAGLYLQESYEILWETYTNALVAYEAISNKLDILAIEQEIHPSDTVPLMDGDASSGSADEYSRGDHVHPSDTTKQDIIGDLASIRDKANKGESAYQKFQTGVKKSDLASSVQESLGRADTSVQPSQIASFITKFVDDLVYYYTKDNVYTKTEVQNLLSSLSHFHFERYASREQVTNPANNVLYLIGPTGTGLDRYDEYVYDPTESDPWVKIGDTIIDLSGYATIEQLNAGLANKVNSLDVDSIIYLTQAEYDSLTVKDDRIIYVVTDANAIPDTLIGIYNVEQTTTSHESGGTNIVTITLTDGTEVEIQIKNGTEPLITADSSGIIYSDGVVLTEVIKDAKDTAEADHTIASEDHTQAATDHSTAVADHGVAAGDHTTATSDHGTASSDHTTAASDHTIASTDHSTATSDHTVAAADHTLAGTDHQTAASDHTLAGTDHTTAAGDHTLAGTDHGTAADDHVQAESDHARAESDHQSIADKADVDGFYERMTVGLAENLIDTKGTGMEQAFIRRTSCGDESIADDGTALFKELRGNTLVWNQLAPRFYAETQRDVKLTVNNDGSYTADGTASAGSNFLRTLYFVAGHKYLLSFRKKSGTTTASGSNVLVQVYGDGIILDRILVSEQAPKIVQATGSGEGQIRFHISSGDVWSDFTFFTYLVDLTLMFGAGNEPSTVAEFEALFPLPYYAYNAGTLINNKASKYVTDGFNQYNPETGKANVLAGNEYQITGTYTGLTLGGETVTPDANGCFTPIVSGELTVTGGNATDTCVHLTWSGYRNGEYEPYWKRELALNLTTLTGKVDGEGESVVIVPDGLKSAGSVYDEGIVEDGYLTKIVKRIGVVDMGTLTWGKTTLGLREVFYGPNPGTPLVTSSTIANCLCSKYEMKAWTTMVDKTMCIFQAVASTTPVLVRDSAYSDAATFKTAMNGVLLNYELATPLVYVLDTPIPMVSKVADFGAETIEPQGVDANGVPNSAPFRAVIKYNDDFTRKIATMEKNFTSKETVDALLSCLGGALNGTITKTWDATNNKWTFTFTPNA